MSGENITAIQGEAKWAGLLVWWDLCGNLDLEKLAAEWDDLGLDMDDLPEAQSAKSALRLAVQSCAGRGAKTDKMTDGGWAVFAKEEGKDDEGRSDLKHASELRVWLDDDEKTLTSKPEDDPRVAKMQADYDMRRRLLDTEKCGGWLTDRLVALKGIALKERGGIYFIPPESVDAWLTQAEAIKASAGHVLHKMRAVRDKDALESILHAIQAELGETFSKLSGDLDEGELGVRGWKHRTRRLKELETKLTSYEAVLSAPLPDLRKKLEYLDDEVAMALVAAEAERDAAKQEAAA
jgi:hypothetical protein